MHNCEQLKCWPATAVVSQLHLAQVDLSHVMLDTKSKHTCQCMRSFYLNLKTVEKVVAQETLGQMVASGGKNGNITDSLYRGAAWS